MNSSHQDRHTAELHQMQRAIAGLLIYQDILASEVGIALVELLQAISNGDRSQGNALICLTAYGRFFKALATENCSWEEYLINRILQAENPFSLQVQNVESDFSLESLRSHLSPVLVAAVKQDLHSLYILYSCGQYIPQWVQQISGKPVCWLGSNKSDRQLAIFTRFQQQNWEELLEDISRYYRQSGVGIFGKYRALKWQNGLVKIANPDRIQIDQLVGYELQKATLIKNTNFCYPGLCRNFAEWCS